MDSQGGMPAVPEDGEDRPVGAARPIVGAASRPEPSGAPQALVPQPQPEQAIIDLDPAQSDPEGMARRVAASPAAAAAKAGNASPKRLAGASQPAGLQAVGVAASASAPAASVINAAAAAAHDSEDERPAINMLPPNFTGRQVSGRNEKLQVLITKRVIPIPMLMDFN